MHMYSGRRISRLWSNSIFILSEISILFSHRSYITFYLLQQLERVQIYPHFPNHCHDFLICIFKIIANFAYFRYWFFIRGTVSKVFLPFCFDGQLPLQYRRFSISWSFICWLLTLFPECSGSHLESSCLYRQDSLLLPLASHFQASCWSLWFSGSWFLCRVWDKV